MFVPFLLPAALHCSACRAQHLPSSAFAPVVISIQLKVKVRNISLLEFRIVVTLPMATVPTEQLDLAVVDTHR